MKNLLTTLGVIFLLWAGLNCLAWTSGPDIDRQSIPLVVLLSSVPVYWLVSRPARQKRVVPGHCKFCGYDLTGNVSGACPECGRKI
ncbi:MAG TPA: hypothetical protein VG269_13645 [Tepidisphaeraceae bacterium]|nr:hypothetical protein [Tepidisphaeraceae bacterium]